MKPDPRIERNGQSLLALDQFLRDIAATPQAHIENDSLLVSLSSQGALARYTDSECGINGLSLNTAKRIAAQYIEGGFSALDERRKIARQAILDSKERISTPKRNSKFQLVERIRELEAQIQRSSQDLLLLTHALERALVQGRTYAQASKQSWLLERCSKEQRELRDGLSLLKSDIRTGDIKVLRSV